jgi:ADP-heptose:LPS heptosyltransferase
MIEPSPSSLWSESPRILILQLNRIGDLILSTPAFQSLRERFPKAHLTLVVSQTCASLIPALPTVDQTLVFPKSLREALVFLRDLLFEPYHLCIDLTGSDRSALLALCSKAPTRLAFPPAPHRPFRRWIRSHFSALSNLPVAHEIDRVLHLLQPLGIPSPQETPAPRLNLPSIARERIGRLLAECGISDSFALIHPGTGAPEKYWLPERWAEVILRLQHEHRLPCVLTGGDDPYEHEHLRNIQTAMAVLGKGPLPLPFVRLAGALDLTLLAALTERARLLVSCDTAIIHIASAFARPQVSLFGPSNPFRWRPIHSRSLIVPARGNSPLEPIFSPDTPPRPMESISVPEVLEACTTLLKGASSPRRTP